MRPLDELTGGVQDPSASIIFGFVFLASFLLLSQALFSSVGWLPVFFGELYIQMLDRLVASFAFC